MIFPMSFRFACGAACGLLLAPPALHAATSTWVGNTDANLATAANWDTLPVSGDGWVFGAAGTSGTALSNNLTTPDTFEVAGISFGTAAAAYVIDSAHVGSFTLTGNVVTTSANDHTIGSNIAVSGSRQINLNGSKNMILTGNVSGSGSITQTAGGTGAKSVSFYGDNSGFTGSFVQNNDGNNRTAFNAAASGSASAAWTFNRNVNGGVALGFAGATIHFGALSGGGYIRANITGTANVSVGALGTNTTFSGKFQQANAGSLMSVTKVGAGTLTLSGSNDHAGATTVNDGTLNITGAVQASDITVNNAGALQLAASKTIKSLAITGAGSAVCSGSETITNTLSLTGSGSTLNLVNTTVDTVSAAGAGGLTLGGLNATDTAQLKLDVGATADKLAVTNGLFVDAGGASIQINNLGISAGQTYPLITFASGSGTGFVVGSGTTVGALTLANPNLSFGVTGSLDVTSTGVNLVTTGATPPAAAYWSGATGTSWNSTSGSNANFTTTAAGGSFLNVLPGGNTQVYFSNNSASNPTHTLGENFSVLGLTYRAGSAAVSTSGANTLNIGTGGITVESGNGGATLSPSNLTLGGDQSWTNDSANPLVVGAAVSGASQWLTLAGSGAIHLGGPSLNVFGMDIQAPLDLKGTSVSAAFGDSTGTITNTGTVAATLNANPTTDASLSGVISDGGATSAISIAKSGAAALTLSGENTYVGGTVVSNGTLKAGSDSAFGTGEVSITAGTAVLDLNGKSVSNPLNNNGATGCVITNGAAGTAVVGSGLNANGAANYVISDFTVNGTGDIRWNGAIRRTLTTGTLTKSGSNTLVIDEANGAAAMGGMNLVVADGTVYLGKTVAASFQNLTITGGTLKMNPDYQVSTGAQIWQGTFANEIFINGGTWDLNDTGTNGISNRIKRVSGIGGTITNSGTGESLVVFAARDANVVPTVSWAGAIKDGTNGGKVAVTITNGGSNGQVMVFSGSHTYTGPTSIDRNTMRAGAINCLSPGSDFVLSNQPDSTLDLNGFDNAIGSLAGSNAASKVLLGSATLTVGGNDGSGYFNGIISGTGGIIKNGTGSLGLTGSNTYTGDTVVNDGVLAVDGGAIPDTNELVINGPGVVDATNNEVVATLVIDSVQMADGTYGSSGSGAAHVDDIHFSGPGIVTVGVGYASWAQLHAGGQAANLDFDQDGVSNGIEYFMNAAAGFTASPAPDANRKVTWTNGGNIPSSAYGTQFVVQKSTDLATWDDVPSGDPNLNNAGDSVSYTLPAGSGKLFTRLAVTPQ